jgi:hypothetical protein
MQEEEQQVVAADDLEQDVEVPVLLNEVEVAIEEEHTTHTSLLVIFKTS